MHVDDRQCPHCAEVVRREARVCKHCGREIKESSTGLLLTIAGAVLVIGALSSATKSCGPSENVAQNVVAGTPDSKPESGTKMWVTAELIDRHTCPSITCGVVGTLDFREAATVEEQRADWVRVSRIYDANCVNGRSEHVEKGNAACTANNGIFDGRFAEWVEAKHLSQTRPADPAETAAIDEALVKDSDDFTRYRRAFVKAAQKLIAEGQCTAADFQEMGGFMKSQNQKSEPVYFTYCGGMSGANRIYLSAKTGEIYR